MSAAEHATPGAATTDLAFHTDGGLCVGLRAAGLGAVPAPLTGNFWAALNSGEIQAFFQKPTRPDATLGTESSPTAFAVTGGPNVPSEASGVA